MPGTQQRWQAGTHAARPLRAGHPVQDWQGLPVRSGQAPLRPVSYSAHESAMAGGGWPPGVMHLTPPCLPCKSQEAGRLWWPDQACVPQEGEDHQEDCAEDAVQRVQGHSHEAHQALQALRDWWRQEEQGQLLSCRRKQGWRPGPSALAFSSLPASQHQEQPELTYGALSCRTEACNG